MAKRKTWLYNLRAFMQASNTGFTVFFSSCPVLIFCLRCSVLLFSYPGSFTYLLSLFICFQTSITLLFCFISTLVFRSLIILSPLSMLGLALPHLAFTTLKIFKQTLLDEFLHCRSTSLAKFLYFFLLFGLLSNKINYKQTFDIIFINSYPLANIYAWEKINLSFIECNCLTIIKLN